MRHSKVLLDMGELAPAQRQAQIFEAWGKLTCGGTIELLSDHDPLPLYYQFACEHAGTFYWEHVAQGPQKWRVQITKGDYPDPGFKPARKKSSVQPGAKGPVTVDTRPLFHRGEPPCALIDEAAAQTPPESSFVLMVPFEPMPLYAKLAREGFMHMSAEQPDGSWRVEFFRDKKTSDGPKV